MHAEKISFRLRAEKPASLPRVRADVREKAQIKRVRIERGVGTQLVAHDAEKENRRTKTDPDPLPSAGFGIKPVGQFTRPRANTRGEEDDGDNVIPSGNSVAVSNGTRLARWTGYPAFSERARATLAAFARGLADHPVSLSRMTVALQAESSPAPQAVILGSSGDPIARAMAEAVWHSRTPGAAALIVTPGEQQAALARVAPLVGGMVTRAEKATAYLCFDFVCQPPVTTLEALEKELSALSGTRP